MRGAKGRRQRVEMLGYDEYIPFSSKDGRGAAASKPAKAWPRFSRYLESIMHDHADCCGGQSYACLFASLPRIFRFYLLAGSKVRCTTLRVIDAGCICVRATMRTNPTVLSQDLLADWDCRDVSRRLPGANGTRLPDAGRQRAVLDSTNCWRII